MTNEADSADIIASGYDAFYEGWGRCPMLRHIWREHVTGPDYPEEFAHISFLPLAALRALGDALQLRAGEVLVDLACGVGGPGRWVATQFDAQLVGRDLSPVAVERATELAAVHGMATRASFALGSFAATGLDVQSADAVMTVDALQYAPDKTAALVEVARILRPGRRFAFVAFELDAARVDGLGVWDDPVGDYRPLLERTGFEVVSYDQLPGWQDKVTAAYGAVIANRDALEAELGVAATAALVLEASITLELQPYGGHVLGVASRQ